MNNSSTKPALAFLISSKSFAADLRMSMNEPETTPTIPIDELTSNIYTNDDFTEMYRYLE